MEPIGQVVASQARPRRRRACVELPRSERLQQGLAERPADAHGLTDRLHLRPELPVRARELLEGEARELDDDVVEGRLEAGRRRLRQVVRDLVQRVSDRELRSNLGDRVARRLRGERRRARDTRVHLDHPQLSRLAATGELDVRAARLHADRANDRGGGVAELLVGLVGERHLRRDGHGVAGVHAHRIEVLDRAHDDDVVEPIADDLELELVPAADGLLDEHLADRRLRQASLHLVPQRGHVLGKATAVAPEREGGSHDGGHRQAVDLLERGHDARGRDLEAAAAHRLLELLAVLGSANHLDGRADQLHAEVLEHARLGQLDGEVQRRLASERRQQSVWALALEHGRDPFEVQRLDVRPVREARVGHDRRGVRVDDDRPVPVLAQHLERLAARVVELARLADHDRPRADDADRLEIPARRHYARISSTQDSRICHASCGPGPASGWNWTERARRSGKSKPSTVPS
jgi:hypothetical protein